MVGHVVTASSPQGRFAAGAAKIDGGWELRHGDLWPMVPAGHSDTCESKVRIELSELGIGAIRSHRSSLLRKDPGHYGALLDDADPELEYYWPDGGGP
jgi:hypothetical protein